MCERCGDENRDCAEEEAVRNIPYEDAGFVRSGKQCPDCGYEYTFRRETRDDRGILTEWVCPNCKEGDDDWYDTLDLGGGE